MKFIDLNTKFKSKDEFFKGLSHYFTYAFGARSCQLLETPKSAMEDFPSYTFKLGEGSRKSYFLYVQFGADFVIPESFAYLELILQSHFSRLHILEIEDLIHRDDVTNLFNQRRLLQDIDEAIKLYDQNKIPFSFLFIDIDHFKSVNDNNGHLVGSKLLIQVGEVIAKQVREIDLVYRYGGDEFVVLLPKCSGLEAEKIGNRILNAIKTSTFQVEELPSKTLSVSIGVSDYPRTSKSREDIISYADGMMYEAKKSGRGKVIYNQ